jgi:hypothetical protein
MEVNKVPGRGPFWLPINLNNIHIQALVSNKHVPITKTGHLQGHSRATSGKDAGFFMFEKSGTHNKPLSFSKEKEAKKKKPWTI